MNGRTMDFKEIHPLWKLTDTFTVMQAAALIAGFDPNAVDNSGDFFKNKETGLTDSDGIRDITVAYTALINSISASRLKARLCHDAEPRYTFGIDNLYQRAHWGGEDVAAEVDLDGTEYVITPIPNWEKTTVARQDLIDWLESRGFAPTFFFPTSTNDADYLNAQHPRYAQKLAAAVRAWQSVEVHNGKSPKQALVKWLREHAAEFGLSDDEGKPNETGIDEVAKVANWQPGGGAPKTPAE